MTRLDSRLHSTQRDAMRCDAFTARLVSFRFVSLVFVLVLRASCFVLVPVLLARFRARSSLLALQITTTKAKREHDVAAVKAASSSALLRSRSLALSNTHTQTPSCNCSLTVRSLPVLSLSLLRCRPSLYSLSILSPASVLSPAYVLAQSLSLSVCRLSLELLTLQLPLSRRCYWLSSASVPAGTSCVTTGTHHH